MTGTKTNSETRDADKLSSRELTTAMLQVVSDFRRAEGARTRALLDHMGEQAKANAIRDGADPGELAKGSEMMSTLNEVATISVRELMAKRLDTNRRSTSLLAAPDVERILQNAFNGEVMTPEMSAAMAMLRPNVERQIAAELTFLSVIDDDPYVAFWKFYRAIITVAVEAKVAPQTVGERPEFRNRVFRSVMTKESWRRLSTLTIGIIASTTVSGVAGGLAALLDDQQAAEMTERLTKADSQLAEIVKEMVAEIEMYYDQRGREIWPNTRASRTP